MNFSRLMRELLEQVKKLAQAATSGGSTNPSTVRQARGLLQSLGSPRRDSVHPHPLPGWQQRARPQRPEARPEPARVEPARAPERESILGVDQFTRDLIMGRMYDVTSSNVHSIGMRIDEPSSRTGQLFIRFLGGDSQNRAGLGSMYEYRDVPVDLFREFLSAASKGTFVWDHIRVRGTVSGHRFSYELVGITEGYVPRQAAIRRGQQGEWYLRRTFTSMEFKNGKMVPVKITSRLPEQRVHLRGPNPERGPGAQALRFTQ